MHTAVCHRFLLRIGAPIMLNFKFEPALRADKTAESRNATLPNM
jgi:hypothetical protein